jgi:tripartite ATP-independent transporter DctM subunit
MAVILIISFLIFVALRIPIAFSLLSSSVLTIILEGIPITVVIQKLFEGLESFPLLAVPFFYLVGNLCNNGGITKKLLRFSYSLVGHFKGALAQVNVVVSMFFAGLSGSSTADTAGIGNILIPAMIKEGYDPEFSVGVTAISSTMGVIIPPSVLMVVYGAMGNVSIGLMFLGGIIPGVLIAVGQMFVCWVYAKKYNYPVYKKSSIKEISLSFLDAIPPLCIPVIIIGGIIFGIFTATESAAVAAVYSLFLIGVFYRNSTPREIIKIFQETGIFMAIPLFCTASAVLFGFLLAYYNIPQYVAGIGASFSSSAKSVLFFVVGLYLIVGMLMDSIPAIIIFLPIIQKLGDTVGIHPVQLGVVVILTLALGLVTPPYGICLLMASKIAGIRANSAFKPTFIFGTVSIAVIILSILFPEIILFIPRLILPKYM